MYALIDISNKMLEDLRWSNGGTASTTGWEEPVVLWSTTATEAVGVESII